jgi:hypothetical protein
MTRKIIGMSTTTLILIVTTTLGLAALGGGYIRKPQQENLEGQWPTNGSAWQYNTVREWFDTDENGRYEGFFLVHQHRDQPQRRIDEEKVTFQPGVEFTRAEIESEHFAAITGNVYLD